MSPVEWEPGGEGGRLGSLAQSVRKASLGKARVILIAAGAFEVLCGLAILASAKWLAGAAIRNEIGNVQPGGVDQAKVGEIERSIARALHISAALTLATGGLFVALGAYVSRAPIGCTVTGLVFELAGIATGAAANCACCGCVLVFKGPIALVLGVAVKLAMDYERGAAEERLARDDGGEFDPPRGDE